MTEDEQSGGAGRTAVVVGAGVFGATAALELRSRGWAVRLLDAAAVPRSEAASTDVSKLVRADYGADAFYTELAERATTGWERWARGWSPPLYHADGLLVLSSEPMAPGSFEHESHRTLTRRGHELRTLGPEDVARDFPAWSGGDFRHGYFDPGAGWAESGAVLVRLLAAARRRGVTIETGSPVSGLLDRRGRVRGVRTRDGAEVRGEVVVVAAGAWTPGLLPELSDVMWATGQPVLHLGVEDPGRWRAPRFPPWTADIARTGWYGFPALDDGTLKLGHHGAGRSVDPDAPRDVDPEWEERCREFLSRAVPELSSAPLLRTRLCLYCDTFDGDFWIDRHPDREGLVVAAGGSGHGFKFAPLLGGIVADVVEGRENRRARRFGWRSAGPRRTEAARADA